MARSSIIATPTQLAALLKRLRLDHALTQKQLGEKMGLSQERISVIESHPEKLSIDQFLTVLMVLDARMEIRTGNSAVADTGNDEAEPW
ncbi:MAG: sigma factor-like helix-turn-helix DNA-binding protein [Acidithiobacillus ferrooxidans]|uniref:Sigma factor-like helix-turn-helix DNA-binding protein n=1 Tax=Acidithiobacillus ferruginosus TaxID=3063951 RepID=A0ACD5IQ08_9PROT|nr:sigma factor-like helix-turn-helix DNA-binding protein [Acidithiobacillus ferruginosus]MDD2748397.1 sigma factor-like helix-turn-helix DNA-binding protein [Acidithiobacillus ferrooxidans]MDD5379169.1 sigma factor-like helix-turn-helix DNA-binding protein [Acidithiobacillus sp.]MBU2814766.1 helix-turn-helix domain-containing protein [Acidithiobacillus ferruginosus]MDD5577569.1 sigma factor-like helix-turn-helix DNA-binding protein [Acidithiobacillus sp.]HUX18143.1 sigma factor-like helix-tur